ncbi:pseudouridine synthase [Chelativorans sp. YIM 93263]|uniref:pseudouridine synthase n=1 Tax=Chelativorans sp. YIM 93263 TaxID=2906648 RepID=UPI00403D70A6
MKSKKNNQRPKNAGGRGPKNPAGAKTSSTPTQASEGGERIAKRLARAGIASRRDAEAMIEAGRVAVNGNVLKTPAFNVRSADRIAVDGKPIPEIERTRLFLFHKPAGVVTTTRDPEGRKTIFDILPSSLPRLISVGRLDINTEGLVLLTNDGGLARILELPSTGWLRRYRVRVHGHVDPVKLGELEEGIAVDGVFYGAIEATLDRKQGSNAWLTLGLREGKNREVKNILGALGLEVTRLIRVSYGPFQLGELAEGAVQEIKGRMLRDQLGQRLVEAAGANFDAPITTPFANKPIRADTQRKAERDPEGEDKRKPLNRKRQREEKREEVRDRLQTKPGTRQGDGKGPSRPVQRRSRASNVWMAPGARPVGKKRAEEETRPADEKTAPKRSFAGKDRKPREENRKGAAERRPGRGKIHRPGSGPKRS